MPVEIQRTPNPSRAEAYSVRKRGGARPFLFQVTDATLQPLFEYLLALHVNPADVSESNQKSKNVVMTYGGFVEFNWPDDLSTLSCSASTGAFIGPNSGLTAGSDNTGGAFDRPSLAGGDPGRRATIAWERQEDLLEIFRQNAIIYDGGGRPVLRGRVMMIYDRGVYIGHFTTFEVKETDEKAFSFDLSWEFKIEQMIHLFGGSKTRLLSQGGVPQTTQTPQQKQASLDRITLGQIVSVGELEQEAAASAPEDGGLTDQQINEALFPTPGDD